MTERASTELASESESEREQKDPINVGPLRPRRFIGKRVVCFVVNKTYPVIWRLMHEGKFPRSRLIAGGPAVAWYSDEVADWLDAQPVAPLKGEAPATTERMTALAERSVEKMREKRQREAEALEQKAAAVTRAPRGQGRRRRKRA